MDNKQKVESWIKDKIDNFGLVDLKLTINPEITNIEEVYDGLWKMIDSINNNKYKIIAQSI